MIDKATYIVLTVFVVVVFAIAFALTRQKDEPQDNFIDRGDRHEVASPISYETKMDEQGAVTVAVEPKELSRNASAWIFEVILDTHSVELDDDLVAQTVLVDDQGNEYRALSWDGDPPGGHHRNGVIKFNSFVSASAIVTLKLVQVGGIGERIFVWRMR